MTDLYRDLLFVLTDKFNNLILTLREHIRLSSKNTSPFSYQVDLGVNGFWNLLLEITFTVFSILCLFFGVILTLILVITSYPFAGLFNYFRWVLWHIWNPADDNKNKNEIKIIKNSEKQN